MATWTAPTTRSTGDLISASIWNTDLTENLKYLKDAPVIDTAVIIGAATTSGIRLDLESGTLAVREGDDSAYAPLIASVVNLPSTGSINFASSDVTITHSANTLAFAGAATAYTFADGPVRPSANDGVALGVSGTAWSDLFLASGGVIDFNAGDVTLTHASNTLTFAGAAGGYVFNDGQFIVSKGTTSEYKMYISGTGGAAGNYVGLLMHQGGSSSAPLYSGGVQLLMTASSPSFLDPSLVFVLQDAGTSAAASVTEKMRLNSAGELTIGYGATDNGAYRLQVNSQIFATNATIATSDGRFKENVQPVSDGLRLISALKPVQFTWKPHDVHNFIEGVDVGFIAQDVEAAFEGRDYCGAVVTKNGEGDNEFLGMADSKLIPLLVSAVQELNAKVAALEARAN